MRCTRCRGVIVLESQTTERFTTGLGELGAWRCVNCGALVDMRMLRNRAAWRPQALKITERMEERVGASSRRVRQASSQAAGKHVD